MHGTRRGALVLLAAGLAPGRPQFPDQQIPQQPRRRPGDPEPDEKLPNGKSQKDAIAKENHKKALNDAEELVKLVQALQDELQKAGDFVVPVNTLRRTEEIEKLARRIRGRLKG